MLDSPEQTDELAKQARELFALYGCPSGCVNLSADAGFAGANNHGSRRRAAGGCCCSTPT